MKITQSTKSKKAQIHKQNHGFNKFDKFGYWLKTVRHIQFASIVFPCLNSKKLVKKKQKHHAASCHLLRV